MTNEYGPPAKANRADRLNGPTRKRPVLKFAGKAATVHEKIQKRAELSANVRKRILSLFESGGFSLEIDRRIENSNFVVNFDTKGAPIDRGKTLEKRKNSDSYKVRPPSAPDIILEIFKQAGVFTNPEDADGLAIASDEEVRAGVKNFLDFLFLDFAGSPHKPGEQPEFEGLPSDIRLKLVQVYAQTPALLYLDSMRRAVQEHKENIYDAQLFQAEQFMAYVGARLNEPGQENQSSLPNAV